MMLIGLTGGIGAGKSTVLKIFSGLGWSTIDADGICRQIYDEASADFLETLQERWGEKIFAADGSIDRRAVAEIVFKSRNELEWLNSVLHPVIIRKARQMSIRGNRPTMFDAPLLYEAELTNDFDEIVAVWCADAIRKKRLLSRGMDSDAIEARIGMQMPSDKKLEMADFAVINNGDIECLRMQCEKLHVKLIKKYGKGEDERKNES